MTALTPEATLRHIKYKAACRELPQALADRMIELFEQDPLLEYAALKAAAMRREMPDRVYHASSLRNTMSIASFGLLAKDPAEGAHGLFVLNQPIGVYVSAEPDTIGVWAGNESSWGIWAIAGAAKLPHRQDPLNPEHFVIECDVPRTMVTFHDIASLDTRHHLDVVPGKKSS